MILKLHSPKSFAKEKHLIEIQPHSGLVIATIMAMPGIREYCQKLKAVL
jgi:hypothetical protein